MMNDTQILDIVLGKLKQHAEDEMPLSPKRIALLTEQISALRGKRTVSDASDMPPTVHLVPAWFTQSYQDFWRCKHHRSAIDNWYDGETACGYGCEKSELRWYDNGCSPATS